jgi:hypothetical protein
LAVRAKRTGGNDGKSSGQAINTNIQKAAQATAHDKNRWMYKVLSQLFAPFFKPILVPKIWSRFNP